MPGPQRAGGGDGGLGALGQWIDSLFDIEHQRKVSDLQASGETNRARMKLALGLLSNQRAEEQAAAQAEVDAQAAAAEGAQQGPYQVDIPGGSPLAQRPVSFQNPLSQIPAGFENLLAAAQQAGGASGAANQMQRGAQANAPSPVPQGGALPGAAQGLPVAGDTIRQRQYGVGLRGEVVQNPYETRLMAVPSFYDNTQEQPNQLTARDVADLRGQEAAAQRRAFEGDRAFQLEQEQAAERTRQGRAQTSLDVARTMLDKARTQAALEEARARTQAAHAQLESVGLKVSPGQRALDTKAGQDYAKSISGGRDVAVANLDKLREVQNRLATEDVTGAFYGAVPDSALKFGKKGARSVDTKQLVESVFQQSAKGVLDSQYAAREMTEFLARSYDQSLDEKALLPRIQQAADWMQYNIEESDRRNEYFGKKGSLYGYTPTPPPPELQQFWTQQRGEGGGQPAATSDSDRALFEKYGIPQ